MEIRRAAAKNPNPRVDSVRAGLDFLTSCISPFLNGLDKDFFQYTPA
jgi:hypothetical protein